MKKKGGSEVPWIFIILIFALIIIGFIYAAFLFESKNLEMENNQTQNGSVPQNGNMTNSTNNEVSVVSDVGGVFRAIKSFFS